MKNEITIYFNGEGNIDLNTLTGFLSQYKEIIFQINHEIGYEDSDLIIEVSPPNKSSFQIKLKPKYKNLIINSIAVVVTTTLSGLLLYHLSKPSDPKSIEEIEQILLQNGISGDNLGKSIQNIYHNSGVGNRINQTFIIIDHDPNITGLKIMQDDQEILIMPKEEIRNFLDFPVSDVISPLPKEDVLIEEATLIIKTIHFEGNAKWAFIYRGYPIKAVIKDNYFLDKLKDEAFRKGDSLNVLLSRRRTFDDELQTYIVDQSSYAVVKVNEHTSKRDLGNSQSKLDFPD